MSRQVLGADLNCSESEGAAALLCADRIADERTGMMADSHFRGGGTSLASIFSSMRCCFTSVGHLLRAANTLANLPVARRAPPDSR